MRRDIPSPRPLVPTAAALLPLLVLLSACGGSGPSGLETARQDTFGFVYSTTHEEPGRGLHVVWSRGGLEIGRAEPFGESQVVGSGGSVTEFWDGEVSPGDTAAVVIGYGGDPKPDPIVVCFTPEEGIPVSCR